MTQIRIFNSVRLPLKNNHKSSKSYVIGDLVHNKIDNLAYKALTNHSGSVDPAIDTSNWELAIELEDKYLLYASTLNPETVDLVELLGYYEIGDGGAKKGLIKSGFSSKENKGSIHNISNNENPVHFELIIDGNAINAHAFGIQGNQKNADRFRWRPLLNYASKNRLKIVALPNQKYIVDNLGTIDDPEYFVDIDFCGSTIKRFIDVKPLPLKKITPISLGTVSTNVSKLNERELEQSVSLNVNPDFGGLLTRNIHFVNGSIGFNALDSSTVSNGDYVTMTDDQPAVFNQGFRHRLITDNTTSPMTFLEQTFGDNSSGLWRDRFFVANSDLSKRAILSSDLNADITSLDLLSNPTQIGGNTVLKTVHEFTEGEELFLYIYESEQDVTYFDGTTETISDLRLRSQYKTNNSTEWKNVKVTVQPGPDVVELDPADNVGLTALLLEEFDSFKMTNYIYDGERADRDTLDLDVNIINNYSIWWGDQSYPMAWYKFIDFSISTKGNDFEISDFVNKNNTLNNIIGSRVDVAIDRVTIKNGVNEDSGGIRFTGKNIRGNRSSVAIPSKISELVVDNIKDSNPYKIRSRAGGVTSRGYQQTFYSNIYKTHNDDGLNFGRGEDIVDIKNVFFTNPFSKQKDYEVSPFFTGFIVPEFNGGNFNVLSKLGDTGYTRDSRMNVEGVKINELFHKRNMVYDLDPVTGGFGMRQTFIDVLYTRTEDGAGNLSITNSDIIGSAGGIDPFSPANSANQGSGGMNVNITNCTLKTHSDFRPQSVGIDAGRTGVIKNLTIVSIDPRETTQGLFYHVRKDVLMSPGLNAGQIIGVKDYVGATIGLRQFWLPNHSGFGQLSLNSSETYDTVSNRGIYDYGGGGRFTERSPIPTELDDFGVKKIVSTFNDLLDSTFFESYKGGFIEVADEKVELAPDVLINRRYQNRFGSMTGVFWRAENEGNNVPLQQYIIKDIQSPRLRISTSGRNPNLFVDSFAQFHFSNISNLLYDSTLMQALKSYKSKHGMSKFIFENVSIVEAQPSSSRFDFQSITLNNFYSSIINLDLISSQEKYPVLKIFNNCQFLSPNRKDGLLFSKIDISNISEVDASKITWLHPQFHKIALGLGGVDFKYLDFTFASHNQEIEFKIDRRSIINPDNDRRAQIINGAEVYDTPGIYRFYIDKITDPAGELILSEIIPLPV